MENVRCIFIKMNIYLILILSFASILFTGCSGSHNNNRVSSPQSAQITLNNSDNSDEAQLEDVKTNTVDLSNTKGGIPKLINNGEFSSLQGDSEVLTMSVYQLIKEDEQCKISPKYQEANKEWRLQARTSITLVENISMQFQLMHKVVK